VPDPGGHGHQHQWKRSPVTDFTVTYECGCGSRHRIQWCTLIPSVSHVDMKVTGAYGGTVTGDAHQAWEFTLSRRMIQMAELGLNLDAEELEPEE
jgi:hypothetical protein